MVYKKHSGSGKFSPQQLHIMDNKEKEESLRNREAAKQREFKKQTDINDEVEEFKKYLSDPNWKQEPSINSEFSPPYEYTFRKVGTQEKHTITLKYRESFETLQNLLQN